MRREPMSRLFIVAITCLAVALLAWLVAAILLDDSPYLHPGKCHETIRNVFTERMTEFDQKSLVLISLGEFCAPPRPGTTKENGCKCFILKDEAADIRNDISGIGYGNLGWAWKFPKSKAIKDLGYRVSVRQLETSIYSVIACGYDGT
jgi:hypothetical protein